MWFRKPKRVYLDYAATTPVARSVENAMRPYLRETFGNPSSIHQEGKNARTAVSEARDRVARALGVQSDEIIFTSGGTESNNLAIKGTLDKAFTEVRNWDALHVVTTNIEASSVHEVLEQYEKRGVRVTYVPVNNEGLVRPEDIAKACTEQTVLVTVGYVNNEIGVVQPIRKIAQQVRAVREDIVIHTDAAQVPLYHNVHMHTLGCDLMSLDAQKIYGPKGVGVLGIRRSTTLYPQFFGGMQERGMRPGTEPVGLIVGLSVALDEAVSTYKERARRVAAVRDAGLECIGKLLPEAVINGSLEKRTPSNINISLPDVDTEYMTLALDHKGFAVSTKSACLSGTNRSHVVHALSDDAWRSQHTLRITIGEETTSADLVRFAQTLAALCVKQ